MELIVVLVVMAVVAVVSVPSYQGYQARARQKEGFNMANTYFGAAQVAKAEFGYYPGNFVATGFQPVGRLNYRLRTEDGTDPPGSIPNDDTCIYTSEGRACDCAGACPNYKTWSENRKSVGVAVGATSCQWTFCAATMSDTTFQFLICGIPHAGALKLDQYSMTHRKEITMCADGLK